MMIYCTVHCGSGSCLVTLAADLSSICIWKKTVFMTQCYATATCVMCFICMVFVSFIAHNTLTFVVVVYFYFSSYIFCQQQQIKR